MTIQTAIEILELHNKWRRDKNVPPKTPMPNPTEIGKAIDMVIDDIKKKLNNKQ